MIHGGNSGPTVLLIGVESKYAAELRRWSNRLQMRVQGVPSVHSSLAASSPVALCVLGADSVSESVESVVRNLRARFKGVSVVVIGTGLDLERAVLFMRAGACDVVPLPADAEELAARSLSQASVQEMEGGAEELVGRSSQMDKVREEIAAAARSSSTVLITGETGVGKSIVAREIHRRSDRRKERFVHVDCTALASSVIESELFGHERGAYTGAVGSRQGRFELAADGTIFLDEIGDLDSSLQAKLLRVLQEREFERVGGTATLAMTARVVAATNRDLGPAVQEGRFRADLLFRLNVFRIEVPPLRGHPEDIPELVRTGWQQLRAREGLHAVELPPAAMSRLRKHAWPGNVRELMNLLERLALEHAGGSVDDAELEAALASGALGGEGPRGPEPEEVSRIAAALESASGNVSRAAALLGLPRSTLRYRIQQYGLTG